MRARALNAAFVEAQSNAESASSAEDVAADGHGSASAAVANAKLAVYRDSDDPVFVANEFRSIERAPSLVGMPDLQKYLREYPSASLPGASEFLYWQEAQFGLKPAIRTNHVIVQDRPGQTVIASKMLYASSYFWTAAEGDKANLERQ